MHTHYKEIFTCVQCSWVFSPTLPHLPDRCLSRKMTFQQKVQTLNSWRHNPKSSPPSTVLLIVRDPLKQSSCALRIRNEILTRMYRITSSYLSPFFSLIFTDSSLWYFWHSWPIAPDVVKTSGVSVPCSTCIITECI